MIPAAGTEKSPVSLTLKITLAGDQGVGKSSLVRRFVSNTFDERYISTLGAKVSSRRYGVEDPDHPGVVHEVGATIWDIMGNVGFREILKDSYFAAVQGVLLVCDGTRPETLHSLPAWSNAARSVAGPVPTIVLINKSDLEDALRVRDAEVEDLCSSKGWRWFPTSAKTGKNVEKAFTLLTQLYLRSLATRGQVPPRP